MKHIFSGDESRTFWNAINSIDNMSTGDDIQNVFYLMGCKLQELESKIEYIADALNCDELKGE
jgi:hypothetical protein